MSANAELNLQLAGRFKLEAVNQETGERRILADWFDNLILDQGLNRLGTGGIFGAMHVGTGSTAPTATDSQLQTLLATTTTAQSASDSYVSGSPDYIRKVITYRFAVGTATGNLSEVGVGWGTSASNLFSRALIKDGSGNPTTITVLSSEALDVSYEYRIYPPQNDVTGSITISGTTYSYTIRPAAVGSVSNYWRPLDATPAYQSSVSAVYTGSLGSRTGSPSGTIANLGSGSSSAYTNNSYQITITTTSGLNDANLSGGIKSLLVGAFYGAWQIEFSPNILKTAIKVLTLSFVYSWARRP